MTAALLVLAASCNAHPAARARASAVEVASSASDDGSHPRRRHPRFGEAWVYVDGQPTAAMHYMELPPSLKPVLQPVLGGEVQRYLLTDYLRSLGIDVAKVRAVHVYGGHLVSPLTGDQVRSHAEQLSFEFGGGDRGKPRMHYGTGIGALPRVDMISALAVYVGKGAPTYHPDATGGFLAFADGTPVTGLPYLGTEPRKGTRIYLDGALVAILKRKYLPTRFVVGRRGTDARFSLPQYMESVGIDDRPVRAIDFLSDDDLVARVDGDEWRGARATYAFTLPAHSHGLMAIEFPQGHGSFATISAVQVFSTIDPPRRWVAPREYVAMVPPPDSSGAHHESAPASR